MIESLKVSKLNKLFSSWKFLRYYWLTIIVLSAMIALTADLWTTRNGPGASGDSVHYMQGADNILAGHGFSRIKATGQYTPITSFPPGYSIVLAGLGALGLPAFSAARFLNVTLFGVNTLLMGLLVFRSTHSGLLAILASWMFMYIKDVFLIHTWVMSEPLFIFLVLLAMLLLDIYLKNRTLAVLILACLIIGYASITRYVGLALIPAMCIPILLKNREKNEHRWRDVFISIGLCTLPLIGWFWRNALVTSNLANRQFGYHPISKDLIFAFLDELSYWWFEPSLHFPWRLRWSLLALFFAIGVAVYLYTLYRRTKSHEEIKVTIIPGFITIFGIFYSIIVILNTTLVDASTDIQTIQRYALLLVVFGIIWGFSTYNLIGRSRMSRAIVQTCLVIAGLGLTLFYASKSVPFFIHPGYNFGYTDIRQNWTCEVNLLKSIDAQTFVITNNYELYYFLAGKPAYTLTGQYDPSLGKNVQDYGANIEYIKNMLRNGAILAPLGNPDSYPGEVNALIGDMHLRISADCSNLRLYVLGPNP